MEMFVLILHVLNFSGETSEFVVAYDLTKEECAEVQKDWMLTMDEHSFVVCWGDI